MFETNKREPQFSDVLRLVAPGTPLREGLENVLRAKTGGLIVVGYGPEMKGIVDGGFSITLIVTSRPLICMNWPRWMGRS
jgi:diadenylate cyclase